MSGGLSAKIDVIEKDLSGNPTVLSLPFRPRILLTFRAVLIFSHLSLKADKQSR
jgi:hypothetical protein